MNLKPGPMADRFFNLLIRSPLLQQAQAEVEEELLAERQSHVDAIAKIRENTDAELPGLMKAWRTAEKKRDKALAALKNAHQEMRARRGDLINLKNRMRRDVSRYEQALGKSAPDLITAFVSEMHTLERQVRLEDATRSELDTGKTRYVEELRDHVPVTKLYSSEPARQAYAVAVREAMHEAELLGLQVLPRDDLTAALDALRDGLPDRHESVLVN